MKNDTRHFYNLETVVDIYHFVELLLVSLANNSNIFFYNNQINKIAILPANYKKIIEKIMYSDYIIEKGFYSFIDYNNYYEYQSEWESNLSYNIKKYLKNSRKLIDYDFDFDAILISFTEEEISDILSLYDKKSIETMNNFITLINFYKNKRKDKLDKKESKRNLKRKYIKTGIATSSKNWF